MLRRLYWRGWLCNVTRWGAWPYITICIQLTDVLNQSPASHVLPSGTESELITITVIQIKLRRIDFMKSNKVVIVRSCNQFYFDKINVQIFLSRAKYFSTNKNEIGARLVSCRIFLRNCSISNIINLGIHFSSYPCFLRPRNAWHCFDLNQCQRL